jgi:hypothetical protein
VAAPREQRDRDAPHPARRTRDEHLAVTGPHAVALEDEDRERRGVPRAAERHRLPLIERRRDRQEEVAVDAGARLSPPKRVSPLHHPFRMTRSSAFHAGWSLRSTTPARSTPGIIG